MDGYLGGRRIDLFREPHEPETAVWYHPGSHPAFAAHIRYGRLRDGRWYVQWTGGQDWAFAREQDAELCIVEIQASRDDGRWIRKL